MEEETQEQEEPIRISGEVLGFRYNQIIVKENVSKKTRVVYFDGLQKRVLSDVDEDCLKRIKRIDLINSDDEFNTGIDLFICCDKCKNALFSLFGNGYSDSWNERVICKDCEGWFCGNCVTDGFCKKCLKKRMLRGLKNGD